MLTRDELYLQGEPIATVAEIRAGSGDIIAAAARRAASGR